MEYVVSYLIVSGDGHLQIDVSCLYFNICMRQIHQIICNCFFSEMNKLMINSNNNLCFFSGLHTVSYFNLLFGATIKFLEILHVLVFTCVIMPILVPCVYLVKVTCNYVLFFLSSLRPSG